MVGWGGGSWGGSPWGGGPSAGSLFLVGALAVRENVVRLTFSLAPNFTGILDPHDASNRARYSVVPVAGTSGIDGLPTRPVTAVQVQQAAVAGSGGTQLDVTVDRPFSPYAAQYRVTANNLFTSSGLPLNPALASAVFYGVQREQVPNLQQNAVRTHDLANPFVASAVTGLIQANNELVAGAFSSDDTGDLALDEGNVSIKKWVLRTCISKVGGFVHAPTYGVGLVQSIKQLSLAATRQRIISAARKQVASHPLIVKSSVTFQQVQPGFYKMSVLARTKAGAGIRVEQLFQSS